MTNFRFDPPIIHCFQTNCFVRLIKCSIENWQHFFLFMKIKIKCLNTSSNSSIKFYLMFPSAKKGMKDHKIHKLYFCDNFIDFSLLFFFFHYSLQHLCLVIFVLFYGRMKKLCKYLRHMLANKEFYVFQCHIIYNQKTTLMQYERGCGKLWKCAFLCKEKK